MSDARKIVGEEAYIVSPVVPLATVLDVSRTGRLDIFCGAFECRPAVMSLMLGSLLASVYRQRKDHTQQGGLFTHEGPIGKGRRF